ncbi:MAG: hypothetical protein JOZ18_16660 [Chloroflexi bacterium]|nr:hypothetical protein [Chloroflexota bacterium]
MISTRIGAAIFVLLLMGSLVLAGIAMAAWLGPISGHGTNVLHVGGDVVQVGPGKNFVFQTTTGEKMAFVCGTGCRASMRHLERHLKEKAHTDVYYVQGPNHELLALDAD